MTMLLAQTSILVLAISLQIDATSQTAKQRHVRQTNIVFEDHEVPSFVVIEEKGKKHIVIDRSNMKTQVEGKQF